MKEQIIKDFVEAMENNIFIKAIFNSNSGVLASSICYSKEYQALKSLLEPKEKAECSCRKWNVLSFAPDSINNEIVCSKCQRIVARKEDKLLVVTDKIVGIAFDVYYANQNAITPLFRMRSALEAVFSNCSIIPNSSKLPLPDIREQARKLIVEETEKAKTQKESIEEKPEPKKQTLLDFAICDNIQVNLDILTPSEIIEIISEYLEQK